MAAVRAYSPKPSGNHIDFMIPSRSWTRSWARPLHWSPRRREHQRFFFFFFFFFSSVPTTVAATSLLLLGMPRHRRVRRRGAETSTPRGPRVDVRDERTSPAANRNGSAHARAGGLIRRLRSSPACWRPSSPPGVPAYVRPQVDPFGVPTPC